MGGSAIEYVGLERSCLKSGLPHVYRNKSCFTAPNKYSRLFMPPDVEWKRVDTGITAWRLQGMPVDIYRKKIGMRIITGY